MILCMIECETLSHLELWSVNHMTYLGGVSRNPPDIGEEQFGEQENVSKFYYKEAFNLFIVSF